MGGAIFKIQKTGARAHLELLWYQKSKKLVQFKKVGQKGQKLTWGVKFENFEKTKKVPLENVKYLSPKMNRKKTADNHNRQTTTTTDKRDDNTWNGKFPFQVKTTTLTVN